jgi:hypothetical protein
MENTSRCSTIENTLLMYIDFEHILSFFEIIPLLAFKPINIFIWVE